MTVPFFIPPVIHAGPGSLERLPECVASLGQNVLLVTGRTFARESGLTDHVLFLFHTADVSVHVFEDVGPEPDLATCDAARKLLAESGCDLVVALGGGSAIDVAKVAAGLARDNRPTLDFWLGATPLQPGVPFIAIPTTSGSGSEATVNGVIANPDVPTKRSIRGPGFIARVALVDPALTLDCPPDVTANAGMDALCQAIESFTSRYATPLTDAFASRAISLLADGLPVAYADPDNLLARTSTSLGSLFAGISMTNARAGVVHGLAHPIGARLRVSHGRLCAMLLPPAMKLNRPAAESKFRQLDQLLQGDADTFVHKLLADFHIPSTLSVQALSPADYAAIIQDTLESGSTKANPKPVGAEDCRAILDQFLV